MNFDNYVIKVNLIHLKILINHKVRVAIQHINISLTIIVF